MEKKLVCTEVKDIFLGAPKLQRLKITVMDTDEQQSVFIPCVSYHFAGTSL